MKYFEGFADAVSEHEVREFARVNRSATHVPSTRTKPSLVSSPFLHSGASKTTHKFSRARFTEF